MTMQPSSPKPVQFNLKTLLIAMTLLAVGFALTQWFSPIVVAAIIFLALTVLAHMAGNAIGTRLQRQRHTTKAADRPAASVPLAVSPKQLAAQPTKLAHAHSLGWPVLAISLGGALLGGSLGGYWSLLSGGSKATLFTISVGVIALGLIGGMMAYIAGSFLQVAVSSLWHALDTPQSVEPSHAQEHSAHVLSPTDSRQEKAVDDLAESVTKPSPLGR